MTLGGANNFEINKWPDNKNIREQLSLARTIRCHWFGALSHTQGEPTEAKSKNVKRTDEWKGNVNSSHSAPSEWKREYELIFMG